MDRAAESHRSRLCARTCIYLWKRRREWLAMAEDRVQPAMGLRERSSGKARFEASHPRAEGRRAGTASWGVGLPRARFFTTLETCRYPARGLLIRQNLTRWQPRDGG